MKFVHTADWHLGLKAHHVGAAAREVRDARIDAARRVIEVAREHAVDFILLAGDTFDSNAVDRGLVQRCADLLATFGGPVYVLPGNHDPLVPGSVWEHPAWGDHPNVHVLTADDTVAVPGGTLHPCPVHTKDSMDDPTAGIKVADDGGIHVGLAHGILDILPGDVTRNFPIPPDAASRLRLDYLALGDWHSFTLHEKRTAYSGAHEPTKFGEHGAGKVLVVTIDTPGATPAIQAVRVAQLTWLTRRFDVTSASDIEHIRAALAEIPDARRTLIDIELRGHFPADASEHLDALANLLTTRFLLARLDDSGLVPSPDDTGWIDDLPAGAIRLAARRLLEQANSADDDRPAVAAQALRELFRLAREARS